MRHHGTGRLSGRRETVLSDLRTAQACHLLVLRPGESTHPRAHQRRGHLPRCYRRGRTHQCHQCGRVTDHARVANRAAGTWICYRCWVPPTATCSGCGRLRPCTGGSASGQPVCSTCRAGPRRPRQCAICEHTKAIAAVLPLGGSADRACGSCDDIRGPAPYAGMSAPSSELATAEPGCVDSAPATGATGRVMTAAEWTYSSAAHSVWPAPLRDGSPTR